MGLRTSFKRFYSPTKSFGLRSGAVSEAYSPVTYPCRCQWSSGRWALADQRRRTRRLLLAHRTVEGAVARKLISWMGNVQHDPLEIPLTFPSPSLVRLKAKRLPIVPNDISVRSNNDRRIPAYPSTFPFQRLHCSLWTTIPAILLVLLCFPVRCCRLRGGRGRVVEECTAGGGFWVACDDVTLQSLCKRSSEEGGGTDARLFQVWEDGRGGVEHIARETHFGEHQQINRPGCEAGFSEILSGW